MLAWNNNGLKNDDDDDDDNITLLKIYFEFNIALQWGINWELINQYLLLLKTTYCKLFRMLVEYVFYLEPTHVICMEIFYLH